MADQVAGDRWALTLYIDGASPRSIQAIETVRYVCDEEFPGRTDLEVVDVRQQPGMAVRDNILAVPALVKRSPGPPCLHRGRTLRLGPAAGQAGPARCPWPFRSRTRTGRR